MSKSYTVETAEGVVFTSSRKDRALKFGETLEVSYKVLTPTGNTVHEVTAEVDPNLQATLDEVANAVEKAQTEETPAEKPARGTGSRYGALTVDRNPASGEEFDDGITVKMGKKWTYIYDEKGLLIAEVRNDAFSTVISALED